MELELQLEGLEPEVVAATVARLLALEPSARAVVVLGSHLKGTAAPSSDLDIKAATVGPPVARYRTWFEPRPSGRPVHVSAGAKSIDDWIAGRAQPARWALGFPALHEAAFLWACDDARSALGDPPTDSHPPAPPELEDFVEASLKARRAAAAGDPAGLRWHAHAAGLLVPGLLRLLNPERVVHDGREALAAALELPVAPHGYRDDLSACLGVVAADDRAVTDAIARLTSRVLAFLRQRMPDIDPQPGIAALLASGSLERHAAEP